MKNKLLVSLMVLVIHSFVSAQNNPIFFGGPGDGASRAGYLQMTNDVNLFKGGIGDGSALNSYEQSFTTNSNGGVGDGYSLAGFEQTFLNHSFGGMGDGHSISGYVQSYNSNTFGGVGDGYTNATNGSITVDKIFFGGVGDGNTTETSGSPTVDKIFFGDLGDGNALSLTSGKPTVDKIFFGGIGDGWSYTALPLTPLPLDLLSFTGMQKDGKHYLDWITATQRQIDYFILQRSSSAGNFSDLGNVNADSDNKGNGEYEYIDEQPLQGNNFYRLKMTDKDGKFQYSNIVLLKLLKDKSVLTIYPNPAASVLNIELTGKTDNSEILIDIYDAAARLMKRRSIKKDNNIFQMDVSGLASGVYTIRIINQEDISNVKFVKQ